LLSNFPNEWETPVRNVRRSAWEGH